MANSILSGRDILILEDEVLLRKRLSAFLETEGADIMAVGTLEEAKRCAKELFFDFALIDIHLPDGLGLSLLKENCFSENTQVVIMTAEGGVDSAVEAMKLGAVDYLSKPFDPNELPIVFLRCQQKQLTQRREEHTQQASLTDKGSLFFGKTLDSIKTQLDRILETDRRLSERLPPVLLEGETGTGKTTLARWLHQQGPRAKKPLVEVNCSTLPETLAESELFGHEKGAFTDARKARVGLFEAASGGTLFLDEIPSLSLPIQAKVLTAIEDGKVRRVGSNKEIAVDVRIIAATNLDLKEQVSHNHFREDLFHRLNLLNISIPALRERRSDLVPLAEYLLEKLKKRYKLPEATLSETGKKRMLHHGWPGNIRELSHQIERSLVMGGGADIDFENLPGSSPIHSETERSDFEHSANRENDWLNSDWQFPSEGFQLEDAINRIIHRALQQTDNNVSAAARLLGVTRDYIRYRLKQEKSAD